MEHAGRPARLMALVAEHSGDDGLHHPAGRAHMRLVHGHQAEKRHSRSWEFRQEKIAEGTAGRAGAQRPRTWSRRGYLGTGRNGLKVEKAHGSLRQVDGAAMRCRLSDQTSARLRCAARSGAKGARKNDKNHHFLAAISGLLCFSDRF